MQRRKRDETLEAGYHAVIDQNRARVVRSAMDDPVSDCQRADTKLVPQPRARDHQRSWNVRDIFDRIGPFGQRIALGASRVQSWPASDAVHLALDLPAQAAVTVHRENLELYAPGPRIDDEK